MSENGLETVYKLHVYELLKLIPKSKDLRTREPAVERTLRKEEGINYGRRKPPESFALIPIKRTKDSEHSLKISVPTLFNKLNSWGVFPDQSDLAGINAESVKRLGQIVRLFCHRQRRPGALCFRIEAIREQRVDSLQSSLLSTEENAGELTIKIITKPFKVPFQQFSSAVS